MLTLFHDYTSPASALAVLRLQRLADEGVDVAFEGFEAVGVDVALPVPVDVLAQLDRLSGEASAEGVVLRRPRALPPTALAHLTGLLAQELGLGASWRETAYRAFWTDGADLSQPHVLAALAQAAGLPPAQVEPLLDDRAAVARLRRRMTEHRRRGVGGVPTVLAQRTLVPGLLPLDDLRSLAALD